MRGHQLSLGDAYPHQPGFKTNGTSADAAKATKEAAPIIREKVMGVLALTPMTADECAAHLRLSVLSVRPRFSELKNLKHIVEDGRRRRNASGHYADVYRVVPA